MSVEKQSVITTRKQDEATTVYVCTYGGSGSVMLNDFFNRLKMQSYHIHDRHLPETLTKVTKAPPRSEFYYDKKQVLDTLTKTKTRVIYVYGDPVKSVISVYSRFNPRGHLINLDCSSVNTYTLQGYADSKQDLLRLEDFHDNYTNIKIPRNFDLAIIRYEDMWENLDKLSDFVGLDIQKKFPVKKTRKDYKISPEIIAKLEDIYKPLKEKQVKLPSFYIAKANLL